MPPGSPKERGAKTGRRRAERNLGESTATETRNEDRMTQWMKTALLLSLAAPIALAGCAAQSDDESIADESTPALESQGGMINPNLSAKNPQPALSPETGVVPGTEMGPGCAAPIQQVPEYHAPNFQAPNYPAPNFGAPNYTAPVYQAPAYQAPNYQAPAAPPTVTAPSYTAPNYPGPTYNAPTYQAPIYQAPTYPAPIYQAPTYLPPNQMIPANATPSVGACPVYAPGYATGLQGSMGIGQAQSPCCRH